MRVARVLLGAVLGMAVFPGCGATLDRFHTEEFHFSVHRAPDDAGDGQAALYHLYPAYWEKLRDKWTRGFNRLGGPLEDSVWYTYHMPHEMSDYDPDHERWTWSGTEPLLSDVIDGPDGLYFAYRCTAGPDAIQTTVRGWRVVGGRVLWQLEFDGPVEEGKRYHL